MRTPSKKRYYTFKTIEGVLIEVKEVDEVKALKHVKKRRVTWMSKL